MSEGNGRTKINHSDQLVATIQRASRNMNFDEYARATGLEKEFIFRILKGEIEEVDKSTFEKLSLKH